MSGLRARAERLSLRLFARDADLPSGVVLSQRRVYILPTRAGFAFAATLALLLLGAINYNLSLGYLLTFLLAALGLVGLLHTWRNLARLVVSAGRAEPVFAGDDAVFTVRLENPSRHERFAVGLVARDGHAARDPLHVDVPAGRDTVARVHVPAPRRGWLALGRLGLDTTWPLGLFRAWAWVGTSQRVLVWPAPEADPPPPPVRVAAAGDGAGPGPGSDDLAGLRAYAPGDPLRHVAWKAYARSGELVTKQFEGQVATELEFALDTLPADLPLEARLSRLAAWVVDAHARDAAWTLRLPQATLPMASGRGHRDACLDALAQVALGP
ncbi:MAG: DUF58 domain-containing protein [Burkholderiales bacterium]|nr:DUF58 domain-containing protein [Burkholderiales bacterium]